MAIHTGKVTTTTATTAVAFTSTSSPCNTITLIADGSNTGYTYVGDSSVTTSTGMALKADVPVTLRVSNVKELYLTSAVTSNIVYYFASYIIN